MGLMLPDELVYVLGLIGLNWPEADEEKLFDLGQVWLDLGGQVKQVGSDADEAAQQVWTANTGDAVDAFRRYWSEHGAPQVLDLGGDAALAFGVGLIVYAAVVLALKINVIVQLILLAVEVAEALATAPETFGASLLEIPVFEQLARTIIENLIMQVIGQILGG